MTNIEPKDVIKIVEATINFLEINLCEENLSPSTEMERLETVERLNLLVSNLKKVEYFNAEDESSASTSTSKSNSLEKSNNDVKQELAIILTTSNSSLYKPDPTISPLVEQTVSKLRILTKSSLAELKKCADYSGMLLKYKKQFISKWNKRFCVLRDGILLYFQSETDTKGKGYIVLGGYKLVVPSNSNGYMFNLVSLDGSTIYSFQADQKKEVAIWLKHLIEVTDKGLNDSDLAKITSLMKDAGASVGDDVINILSKTSDGSLSRSSLESEYGDVATSSTNNEDVTTYCPPPTTDYEDPPPPSFVGGLLPYLSTPPQHVGVVPQPQPSDEIYEDTDPSAYGDVAPPNTLPLLPPKTIPLLPPSSTVIIDEDIYEDVAITQDSYNIVADNDNEYGDVADSIGVVPEKEIVEESIYEDIPSIMNKSALQMNNARFNSAAPLSYQKATFLKDNIFIAACDCTGNDSNDLSFKCGDVLYVTEKIDLHWWIAVLNGKAGLVPSNFLKRGFSIVSH